VEEVYNYKRLIGELSGAAIAVVWIAFALLARGNLVFLVIAIDLTLLLGTLSGGLIGLSKKEINYKEIIVWLLGVSIGVTWITWAILFPGDMLGLVVAISLTILFGVLSGGLNKLSKKDKVS
jgi:hypothetical protein